VYRVVGGSPVEVLVHQDGEQLELDLGTGLLALDPPLLVRQPWKLSQPLGTCLGDPLAQPPAQDIAAFRKLALRGREGHWRVELSGRNVCALEGVVKLDVTSRQVDTSELTVDGEPWKEGGMELARGHLADAILPEGVEVPR
jgi:hypothetical protein